MISSSSTPDHVLAELSAGGIGLITLNRPKALNALSLGMIRALTAALNAWRDDPAVKAVAVRGMGKGHEGVPAPFGAFCAGGDIRFFHEAALAGDTALEAFFTEEYALNHLIHQYPKPYLAFMDGIVMGGGMGISQGASLRVVTERTKMAMPETRIGLFPDVGGGYFLSRLPGHLGEYLALTGHVLSGGEPVTARLADGLLASDELPRVWQHLADTAWDSGTAAQHWVQSQLQMPADDRLPHAGQIDAVFGLPGVADMLAALERADTDWAHHTAEDLRTRSPLMLHVALEQVRRARGMGLADDLRMERDLVYRCFHLRPGDASETVEGIRALAVDKDHAPRWNPPAVAGVSAEMVAPFFISPWDKSAHPLAGLRDTA